MFACFKNKYILFWFDERDDNNTSTSERNGKGSLKCRFLLVSITIFFSFFFHNAIVSTSSCVFHTAHIKDEKRKKKTSEHSMYLIDPTPGYRTSRLKWVTREFYFLEGDLSSLDPLL